MNRLYVIGFGVGNKNFWTRKAAELFDAADRVLCTADCYRDQEHIRYCSLSELMQELQNTTPKTTAVLVGGDCGFYSIAKTIRREFGRLYEIELVSGISSVSYLSAKIGVPYDDAKLVSLHGRETSIVPHVVYNRKVFALTGGTHKANTLCRDLLQSGLADVDVVVGENLSRPNERIMHGKPETLSQETFDDLAVVYVENVGACNPRMRIRDGDFIRGDVPMTKEEVRAITLRQLDIQPTDIVFDIGAGTGAMSVETARQACESLVFAVEMKEQACTLIEQNRVKFGAYNMMLVRATAPKGLRNLPAPDKVFVGGSSGNFDAIVQTLLEMNPHVRIVANAVSLQSLNGIIAAFEKHGLETSDVVCVNIARSRKVGTHDIMTAQNPVTVISGSRRR